MAQCGKLLSSARVLEHGFITDNLLFETSQECKPSITHFFRYTCTLASESHDISLSFLNSSLVDCFGMAFGICHGLKPSLPQQEALLFYAGTLCSPLICSIPALTSSALYVALVRMVDLPGRSPSLVLPPSLSRRVFHTELSC